MKKIIVFIQVLILRFVSMISLEHGKKYKNQSWLSWFNSLLRSISTPLGHAKTLGQLLGYKSYWNKMQRNGKGSGAMGNVGYFMLMSSTATTYEVVGKLPKGSIGRQARLLVIYNATALSTWITTIPVLTMTGWKDNLLTANTAQSHVRRDGKGPRDSAMVICDENFELLLAEVQKAVNLDKANAQSIVDSCGLFLKVSGGAHEVVFHGEYGHTGEIALFAAGIDAGFHQWYHSYDGITYTLLQSTFYAETVAKNLTVGIDSYFQHQFVDGDGPHDIETIIVKMMVK
jgi:hypothetical protein